MNNCAILPVHNRLDVCFSHGKGSYLYDDSGKEYLDFGAGIAVNCLGHCHPKLVETLQKQAEKLWHVSNLYKIKELEIFAKNLTSNTFADYVFFCNSGAESIECGIKMIRKYFYTQNQPHRNEIITFAGAFHGRTIATISAAAKPKYLEGFQPALGGFKNVEFNNIEAVKQAINKNTAGILIEPIQGEEGIRVADKEFIKELRQIADDNDLLLFFDEVQCGMGRTGHLYAYQHYGITPDIIASAKGIGGGFPLGACLATKNASKGMGNGTHGTTYGGNPLAMAVGNAVLEEITKENFLKTIQENAQILTKELKNLQDQFPDIIAEIRGMGLMIGIQLTKQFINIDIVNSLKDNGLLVVGAGENVIRILPPLNIEKDDILKAISILHSTMIQHC